MKRKNSRGFLSLLVPLTDTLKKNPLLFLVVGGAYVLILGLLVFSQEKGLISGIDTQSFQVGSMAEQDLIVDRDIAYDDPEATRLKREAQALLVPPVFIKEYQIGVRARESFRTFSLNFQVLLRQGASPAALFLQIQSLLPGFFTQEIIAELSRDEDISSIIGQAEELLYQYLEAGVFRLPQSSEIVQSKIELWDSRNGSQTKELIDVKQVITLKNFPDDLERRVSSGELPPAWVPSLKLLLDVFLEENSFYDEIETETKRQAARNSVEPVTKILLEGERIIPRGTIVTEEDMIKIKVLGSYTSAAFSSFLTGTMVLLLAFFLAGAYLTRPPLMSVPLIRQEFFIFLSFLVFYFLLNLIVRRFFNPQLIPVSVFLPGAMVSMMVAILISPQAGIMVTLLYSLGYLIQTGMDAPGFLFTFLTGITGTISVINAEKRGNLIRSSFLSALSGGFILLSLGLLGKESTRTLFIFLGMGLFNGLVCGILNLGVLPFIEHILNSATAFRLRELSDLNTPLFKRMLVLAPGTYSHSIAVANLAESAAREIGANGLVARVGAYYHDIGKIEQAEYFAENQTAGNKHDDLKSTLSIAVIKSHVKLGVEKAKDLGLPQAIIDIVAQHHGSGLISYFYIQALKEQEGSSKIKKEDYSYNGQPPLTREAAIVMLADSVEAASRTLEKPNVAKLEKFVWEIIMTRINEGQMRRCDLTFRDMESIKKTFVQILAGYFHTRIEYPDEKEALKIIANGKARLK